MGPVGPEPVAIMRHPCGIEVNFILNAHPDSKTNVLMDVDVKHAGYTHMALTVDSIEKAEAAMKDAGVEITGRMEYEGTKMIFVRDPDRNTIEFNQPARK
eukprot:TRINITY_DN10103_c0_g1_i1.p3 TRINITY_DN10103_c0_g1~~TRINITY_DN10103_c0_g1_i1.p3  ORF type:complete len:100 (-),score=36.74 TRINITY_DN10103_c0_g1_i1:83-382(-)